MVGAELPGPQWQTTSYPSVGPDDRDRCIRCRMGGELPRPQHRRPMDSGRTNSPHKLPGAPGSFLSTDGFLPQQRSLVSSPAHGRHSNCFPESHRGTHSLPLSGLAVEIWEWWIQRKFTIHAPSWSREHQGRLDVTAPGRFERLEIEQRSFPETRERPWPVLYRLVRLSNKRSAPSVLQLEARPGSSSHTDLPQAIHVSSLRPDPTMPSEAHGRGVLSDTHCPVWPNQTWFPRLLECLFSPSPLYFSLRYWTS